MLCQSCQQIFKCDGGTGVSGKINKSTDYPVSLRLVQASGQRGCGLCAHLHRKLQSSKGDVGDKYCLKYQLSEHWDDVDHFRLSFTFRPLSTNSQSMPGNASVELSEASCYASFQIFSKKSNNTIATRRNGSFADAVQVFRTPLPQDSAASAMKHCPKTWKTPRLGDLLFLG